MMRIGIDFGGVIASKSAAAETLIRGRYNDIIAIPANPQALSTVASLVELTQGNVWIVSKVSAQTETNTLAWMDANDFFSQTGIPREHVKFCRKRAEKKVICSALNINTFIDDTIEILELLDLTVPTLFLFGSETTSSQKFYSSKRLETAGKSIAKPISHTVNVLERVIA